MLEDIRIHLDADEAQQRQREKLSAEEAIRNFRRNVSAFKAYVPSLAETIEQSKIRDISIFTNSKGEFNIVNYSNGLVFYNLNPEKEVAAQYVEKSRHCTYCDITNSEFEFQPSKGDVKSLLDVPSYASHQSQPPLEKDINVLVVMGIGLGWHIKTLVEQHNIKHIVIYEPEEQYFLASMYAMDWRATLESAKKKGTGLYFQLNNDGTSLASDIEELRMHAPVSGFYFYRHYNCNTFNALEHALLTSSWKQFSKNGISRQLRESQENILPIWSNPISLSSLEFAQKNDLFKNNIASFKRYVPNIASEFENYEPDYWLPVQDKKNNVNVVSGHSLTNWYSATPFADARVNFDSFSQYPNKDGLVLGYNGVKLKHYHHFQFVKQAEKLLKAAGDKMSKLPQQIKSLILFGIGPQLSTLFENNEVEKLFICEPNRDLFYASLYLIDWTELLENVDRAGGRLYINVGDDGSNLFRDLLNQFYSVGPYILANTYFYQTYHNTTMVHTISQLREQLQVVIAMGENFDHARYGIAHTKETLGRRYPLLGKKPASKLPLADKEIPVFIVGNGPSLDETISTIKALSERAIIVSCGTALMPLYKSGIVPDFHAEIEQNRSTFDWSCRINDFEYLKQVDLLSCNGIHPDTCALFRNTYIAFKEGESSTVSSLNILGEKNYEELQFAYPTVSNFAINLFTLLGFQQLYLFGIDLGFANKDKHHSMQSGYYDEKGQEKYSYSSRHNTSIVVPGNFKPTVFTKYEFKVSKAIIERTLAKVRVDCFNTSDGARISGTKPLRVDDILLVSTREEKDKVLAKVKGELFTSLCGDDDFFETYDAFYHQPTLKNQLEEFIGITQNVFESSDDAERYTERLKEKLLSSYQQGKSLLFYYLYGTVNFANSAFSKLLYSSEAECDKVSRLNALREVWLGTLEAITGAILQEHQTFDHVSSFVPERETVFMREQSQVFKATSMLNCVENQNIRQYLDAVAKRKNDWLIAAHSTEENVALLCDDRVALARVDEAYKYNVIVQVDENTKPQDLAQCLNKQYTVVYHHSEFDFTRDIDAYLKGDSIFYHALSKASWTVKAWIQRHIAVLIIPKLYFVGESKELSDKLREYAQDVLAKFSSDLEYIDFPNYIMVPKDNVQYNDYIVDRLGNRGVVCVGKPTAESLFFEGVSASEGQQQIKNNMLWWGFESE
ncbi:DUF115 domain-containing protein [Alteromonas sp.]|nr:DUF115 domain-containing protein [Alteromonas sp.]